MWCVSSSHSRALAHRKMAQVAPLLAALVAVCDQPSELGRSRGATAVGIAILLGMVLSWLGADVSASDDPPCPVQDCLVVTGERITCKDGWICSDGRPVNDSLDCYLSLTAQQNAMITSPYGTPRPRGPHTGVDLGVPTGTPVYAAKAGAIAEVAYGFPVGDRSTPNGNFIRINYDDGTQGVFLHLERVLESVRNVGTGVDAGDQIGTTNDTGQSSGPHLHYTQYRDPSRQETDDPVLEHPHCG